MYNGLPNYDSERGEQSDYDQPLSARPLPPCPIVHNGTLHSSGYASDSAPHYAMPLESSQNIYGSQQPLSLHYNSHFGPPCQQCYKNGLLTMPNMSVNHGSLTARHNHTLPPAAHLFHGNVSIL